MKVASVVDGGWGWMCVLGTCIITVLAAILVRSYGIFYLQFLDHYQVSPSAVSWVGATNTLVLGLFGPLASAICRRFSCRVTTLVGALILGGGMIATSYAPNYPSLFVSYSLAGVGMCLTYTPGYIILGYYFDKKKATAIGLASVGTGIGTFAYPPFLQFLFRYYGYQGALLITGGILLHALVSASLFRPIEESHSVQKEIGEVELEAISRQSDQKQINGMNENINSLMEMESCGTNTTMVPKSSEVSYEIHVQNGHGYCGNCISMILGQLQFFKMPVFLGNFFVNIGIIFALENVSAFIVAEAIEHGIDEIKAGFLLSVWGITDTIAKLISGIFLDWKIIKPHRPHVFNASVSIVGLSTIMLPLVDVYAWYVIWMSVLGLAAGTCLAHRATILSDLLGPDKAADAFGFIMMAYAIGSVLGRIAGGIVKNNFGGYQYAFYFSGIVTIFFSVVFLVL